MSTAGTETVTLHPRRWKTALLLLICLAFTLIAIAMIRDGQRMGWFVVVFFSLCTVTFGVLLLPGSAYLRLTPEGFETRSLFRTHHARWADITAFRAGRIGLNAMVLIQYAPSYAHARKLRAVSAALTGAEGALPDTYGHSAQQLAELLNEWRDRAVRAQVR
jgi:hypothetical protein